MRLIQQPPATIKGKILYTPGDDRMNLPELPEKALTSIRGKEISMIFQEPMTSLNPVFTCGSQVMEVLLQHQKIAKKVARQRTIELFKEVQLPRPEQIFDSYPFEISGGQKQRVMIAIAIACNPKILIADEPTTALDVTVQKTILKLIVDLKQRLGLSVMFITHDLGVIAEIADRVLVMYKGKIVEQGTVKQIFEEPQHPYTKGLIACRPPVNIELDRLPVMNDFIKVEADGTIVSRHETVREVLKENKAPEDKKEKRLQHISKEKPLLKVENLSLNFPIRKGILRSVKGFIPAVKNVSFSVYPGEVMGLVGESGCGKTTLGRSILRLIEPSNGSVEYKNKNILNLSKKEMRILRKDMQIVFQDPYSSLNPHLTVGRAIQEPMLVHSMYKNDKERRLKVENLLEKVGLSATHYSRYPHEFSGGQRQRICIARALALNPQFIICDESVSALDVSVQAQVLNLLNDLKSEFNLTYIFISHDLSVVRYMADMIIVMKEGSIVETGPANQVFFHPKEDYTRNLIASIPGKGII
jgi:peptide/nickel transport system ATP-binding protein